jgi:CubicO group peptidase (beta-lactamase class C family)
VSRASEAGTGADQGPPECRLSGVRISKCPTSMSVLRVRPVPSLSWFYAPTVGAEGNCRSDLRGVVLAVRRGSIAVQAAGGPADVDTEVVCTADTRFPIASVSKQFTAAAVLLLVERGAVALDDPLSRWFGRRRNWWHEATVHQLLTHTSGLGHWDDVGGIERFCRLGADQRLAAVQQARPRAAPGRQWSYSGLAYLLLGHLVERVDNRSYGAFLQAEIFSPLGMAATSSGPEPTNERTAHGHRDGIRVPMLDLAALPGTGDVWSTATDLARYSSALRAGELLTPRSRRALTAPQARLGREAYSLDWVEAHSYGYGHFIGSLAGRPAAFHPGDNPGYQSFSASIPDVDTSIVVLLNDDAPDVRQIVRRLASTVLA